MTLILTIANSKGAYQSSDFRLTDLDTGAPIATRAGCKQLEATFERMHVSLAFTGVAWVNTAAGSVETIDLIRSELIALPAASDLEAVHRAISTRCVDATKPLGSRGLLTVVIVAATIASPFRVAVVSNADWHSRPPRAKSRFTTVVHTATRPLHLISGYRDCVPVDQRNRLKALARDLDKAPSDIEAALKDINRISSVRSRDYVSEDCWTASQFADGRALHRTAGGTAQVEGNVPLLLGGVDVAESIKQNFRPELAEQLRLLVTAGVLSHASDQTAVAPPVGDARELTLGWDNVSAVLRSPRGAEQARIEVAPTLEPVKLRLNEEVRVLLGTITIHATGVEEPPFPLMPLPWPHIPVAMTLDGALIPNPWRLSIGYWIERGKHRATIPLTSRGVRSVAFLGSDGELLIVAPTETLQLEWSDAEALSVPIEARVSWRQRVDGTRA
jgi:hypothetical protein